jgi:acyl-CoA synthetase (AMP-forming)/AMP-acid ligase II
MLNVSGHLLSTADVESVLIEHPMVAETAVVARPHPVKGECLYCFITVKDVSQVILSSFSFCSRYKEEDELAVIDTWSRFFGMCF